MRLVYSHCRPPARMVLVAWSCDGHGSSHGPLIFSAAVASLSGSETSSAPKRERLEAASA